MAKTAMGWPEASTCAAFGRAAATARLDAARSLPAPTTAIAAAAAAATMQTTASAVNAIARLRIRDSQPADGEAHRDDESGGEEPDRGLQAEPRPDRAEDDGGEQPRDAPH